jgi:hypothetical protein
MLKDQGARDRPFFVWLIFARSANAPASFHKNPKKTKASCRSLSVPICQIVLKPKSNFLIFLSINSLFGVSKLITSNKRKNMETETNGLLEKLEGYNKVESIKEPLRAKWQNGNAWRLEFGRLLIAFRKEARHGEWIQFLEKEFGLHRQTAFHWMQQAKKTDGLPVDETLNLGDETDPHAEEVEGLIAEEQEKIAVAKTMLLNGPKPIRLVLDAASEDEKESYKEQLKRDHQWVQGILRRACDEILVGNPVIRTAKTLEVLPDEPDAMFATDADLPAIFQQQPESADVSA